MYGNRFGASSHGNHLHIGPDGSMYSNTGHQNPFFDDHPVYQYIDPIDEVFPASFFIDENGNEIEDLHSLNAFSSSHKPVEQHKHLH